MSKARVVSRMLFGGRRTASIFTTAQRMSVEGSIKEKLSREFKPVHLEVLNESYMHNVPKGSETHFKVVVISDEFKDKKLIQRHRMVNSVLKQELDEGVHALSIQAQTPDQWEACGSNVTKSPPCMGGAGK
ncbi:DNA-binding transcriptional regulator BolA [Nematostella vectensis]|uniref:DNA-binding transcriptional regulator BolA n=1 Tax=Nematostella vectensis TaxID=45351 RepID=UPI0013906923|nr:DNA-binding transcriptional regulator BolA [Nematostella vectensis]